MPKTKGYVLNTYRNIMLAVASGRLQCLPVFTRSDRIGVDPSIIYVLASGTKVEQPYRIASKSRILADGSLAKQRQRKSNRVDIPPGPLIAVYVPIGSKSPLQEIIARADRGELREWYIFSGSPPRVKIFQFVRDLSAALRQTEHMFANYNGELTDLRETQLELSEKLRRHRSGFETLGDREVLGTRVALAATNLRVSEIAQIATDRVARDFNLQFVAQSCYYRLQSYAGALENMAESVLRMGKRLNRSALRNYIISIDAELTFFASKEIRPYRSAARRALYKILRDSEEKRSVEEITLLLRRSGCSLTRGSIVLIRWAETLGIEETREAREFRQLVTLRPVVATL